MVSTAQAYVDWYNGRGGAVRLRLEVVPYGRDPREALARLRARGASVVLGASTSELALAAAPVAEAMGLPLVSPTAQAEELSGRRDAFFRVQHALNRNAERTAALLRHLDANRVVAFVSRHNEAYARETVLRVTRDSGLAVDVLPAEGPYEARQARMEAYGDPPSVVWIAAHPETSFWLCRQIADVWPRSKLLLSTWSLSSGHERLEEIEGLSFHFVENVDPWSEEEGAFGAFLRENYRRRPSLLLRYTALALDLIAAAAEEGNATGEGFRSALAPRLLRREGTEVAVDEWGDRRGRPRVCRRADGRVEEVPLPW